MSLPLETSLTPTAAAIAPQIWNLAAVILGGVIATTTSYLMQRKANKDIIKRDNTMRHETQKVGALRAMFKLLKISNGLHSTKLQIDQMFTDNDASPQPLKEPWM